jgi:hypothetical protein
MGASFEFKNQLSYYSAYNNNTDTTAMTFGVPTKIDTGTPSFVSIPNNNNIVYTEGGEFDVRQVGYYKVYVNFLFSFTNVNTEEFSLELYINEEKAHGGKSAVGFEGNGGKGGAIIMPVVASWIVYCGYNDNNGSNSGLSSSVNTLTFRVNALSNPTSNLEKVGFNTTITKID